MPDNRGQAVTAVPPERIQQMIFIIRGQKVMLDRDLARLYGVKTKALVQAMKRNIERFPSDFMFQMTNEEFENLRSHIVTSSTGGGNSPLRSKFATSKIGHGGRRYLPYVFTEHGAIMLAGVLNTPKAIETSIFIVRAFVRLREILSTHKELARKFEQLERKVAGHDRDIQALVAAIRQLMTPTEISKRRIGFKRSAK